MGGNGQKESGLVVKVFMIRMILCITFTTEKIPCSHKLMLKTVPIMF